MKRITLLAAPLGLATIFAVAAVGQQPAARAGTAAPPQQGIPVKITDASGKPVQLESLPADVQAQVQRVRRAAASVQGPTGGGGAQQLVIDIRCSYPPLKCTITISW
jgi:hypothetical protein